MIYVHRKTGQKLKIKEDCGDIASCYILNNNLEKIKSHGVYKVTLCHKHNLVEIKED